MGPLAEDMAKENTVHTVLVVDAEEPFQVIAARAMEQVSCRVVTASDGIAGIRAAQQEHPDLILLDVELPGIGGLETCQRLMAEETLRDIPVICLSSKHDYQLRLDALNAGAVDFMIKPYLVAELQARVKTQLRLRALHADMIAYMEALKSREAQEALRVFALGIGHNFNNLLTAGLGFLALSQEAAGDLRVLGYLRNVELAMERMCGLSRQLLAITGELATTRRVVPMRRLLRNAVAIFDPVALQSRAVIICDLSEVGQACVLCDEFSLTQAVLHLLNNARESMLESGGRVTFTASASEKSVRFVVADVGVGMSAEILDQVRQPFLTTHQEVGRGLGLSLVDGVVRDLGGEMQIESTEGDGTTVTVDLPRSPEELDPAVFVGEFAHGLSVLVATDVPETAQVLQAVLVASHFYVTVVQSREVLLSALTSGKREHSAVVVDLLRTDIFGDELVRVIRDESEIPVVYLLSTPNETLAGHASLQVLRKPFTAEQLLAALRMFPQLVRYD